MNGSVLSLNGMHKMTVNKKGVKFEKNIGTKENPIWTPEMIACSKKQMKKEFVIK